MGKKCLLVSLIYLPLPQLIRVHVLQTTSKMFEDYILADISCTKFIKNRNLRISQLQKHISKSIYRTRAIITRGLYTFYPLFEVHLCTVTFGLMYGQNSRAVSNQERVIVARVRYLIFLPVKQIVHCAIIRYTPE